MNVNTVTGFACWMYRYAALDKSIIIDKGTPKCMYYLCIQNLAWMHFETYGNDIRSIEKRRRYFA